MVYGHECVGSPEEPGGRSRSGECPSVTARCAGPEGPAAEGPAPAASQRSLPMWERVWEALLWEEQRLRGDESDEARADSDAVCEVITALEAYDPDVPLDPDPPPRWTL